MSERLIASLMKQTRLLSQTGASSSDAALVERFVSSRDEAAFTTLVHRHGPMVWAVCRNALPNEVDAEDAFQATFLALVRHAKGIRRGGAIAAWLHGTAVRVCKMQRRGNHRRVLRETLAAREEAIPQATRAWSDELTLAHDAIRTLPCREHEVFVLCVLEGVSQQEAARRLGLKVNSVSGLVARASKRLRSQLASSGAISLGALAVASSCPAAVPGHLSTLTCRLASPLTVPSSYLLVLSASVMESTMRKTIMIALMATTLGLGITAGSWFLGNSDAQEAFRASGQQYPLASYNHSSTASQPWEYKVLLSNANSSVEVKLNELGAAGWEICSTSPVTGTNQVMFVLKRQRNTTSTTFTSGQLSDSRPDKSTTSSTINVEYYGLKTPLPDTQVFLKRTNAEDVAQVLRDVYRGQQVEVNVEREQNSINISGTPDQIKSIKRLIESLDRLNIGKRTKNE
jgi:RNA polymerase sigma factor (sigma-70 family)